MAKVAKNGRKVKAIASLFCCFLPTYEKRKEVAKNGGKLRLWPYFLLFFAIALLFAVFCPLVKSGKSR
jgi:hypothetical protein